MRRITKKLGTYLAHGVVMLFLWQAVAQADTPFLLPSAGELSRLKSAVIITNKGRLVFELFPDEAPWHVANFKYLADKGFYRGKTFHFYQPGFILQAGEQRPSGEQILHYSLPPEFGAREHEFGVLGMARPPDWENPSRNSSANQFHILLGRAQNMDGNYTIFGKLIAGEEVLESLRRGDQIRTVEVFVESPERELHTLPTIEPDSFVVNHSQR